MTGTPPSTNANDHYHHTPEPNELGKVLNSGLAKSEPYWNQILIAVVVLVVLAAGYVFWKRSSDAQKSVGWSEFALCRAPDDYLALADKYPDAPVGQWARLQAARQFLGEGLAQTLTNRAASDERLQQSQSAYDKLLKQDVSPLIREEALYGLATAQEALSSGDEKTAIQTYEQLLKEFPQSQHRLWAKERIEALKAPGTSDFYAWFRKQNPKPADRPSPLDIPATPPEDVFKDIQLPTGNPPKEGSPATEMKLELPKPEGEPAKPLPGGATPPADSAKSSAPAMPADAPKADAPKADAPKADEAKPAEEAKK